MIGRVLTKSYCESPEKLRRRILAAKGDCPADLVIKDVEFLDVFAGRFIRGDVACHDGIIVGIGEQYSGSVEIDGTGQFLVPGFIDSHVHIESSLMTPCRFQQAVLPCGTTTAIWDPHEIANVKGVAGIDWAIESTSQLAMDIFIMVPSCVPSTSPNLSLETSGATLNAADLEKYRDHPRVLGLAEMMNFPGLLSGDPDVLQKLTQFSHLRRDGHCPGLSGRHLNAYAAAGIHSCHESVTLIEAKEKLMKGIHVLIREGSCAKNAATLLPLLDSYSSAVLALCSDDRNPADIASEGHINFIIDLALRSGHRAEDAFRTASFAPARMYGLDDRGALAPGFLADLCLIRQRNATNWRDGMTVGQVIKRGRPIEPQALASEALTAGGPAFSGRNINLARPDASLFSIGPAQSADKCKVNVIDVIPNQIVTNAHSATLAVIDGNVCPSIDSDILKIAVIERHHQTGRKFVAFVRGFGLKTGAIATSINHDSHNVIVVGSTEESMAMAVGRLIDIDGGIVVTDGRGRFTELPLPIGGLMTHDAPEKVTERLRQLKAMTKDLGCKLYEPFLQLSFLALPVIPTLKITDRGLVDVGKFELVSVFVE